MLKSCACLATNERCIAAGRSRPAHCEDFARCVSSITFLTDANGPTIRLATFMSTFSVWSSYSLNPSRGATTQVAALESSVLLLSPVLLCPEAVLSILVCNHRSTQPAKCRSLWRTANFRPQHRHLLHLLTRSRDRHASCEHLVVEAPWDRGDIIDVIFQLQHYPDRRRQLLPVYSGPRTGSGACAERRKR